MSNGSFPPRPGRLSGALVVLVALVPACFAGWLLWDAVAAPRHHGHHAGGGPSSGASAGHRASGTPRPSSSPSSTPGKPLAGKVVVLDPGHNPTNHDHVAEINRLVNIGTNKKECDTTGTETNAGYPEASFTLDVSRRARKLLQAEGAKVILTQNGDRPYGPCVTERAEIGNKAHADAAISIHADGAPAGHRGFHVIAPARVHTGRADTRPIVKPSRRFAERLIGDFEKATGSPRADYINHGAGLDVRGDLGGLNLSTVPKVFIECGNMRDPRDAAKVTDAAWRQRAARGIVAGITDFLRG